MTSTPEDLRTVVERNAQAVKTGNFMQLMADITPEALAVRLRNLTASLVKPDSPIFERALHGAVQSLERLT